MSKKILLMIIYLHFSVITLFAMGKKALLIGISDYPYNKTYANATWNPIHGANDVNLLNKTLKAQGFKVHVLKNKEATAGNIRKAFYTLKGQLRVGDVVYIHISSHGQPVEDLSGDEKDGWDESVIPYDALKKPIPKIYHGENHLIDDELQKLINTIREKVGPSGFVYVVIDACHAGGFQRGEDETDDGVVYVRGTDAGFSPSNKKYIPRIDSGSSFRISADKSFANICMIEACRSYQSNCEIKQDGFYYGPLSYYINKVIRTNHLSSDVSWVTKVNNLMKSDNRLFRQNMVIEKSTR